MKGLFSKKRRVFTPIIYYTTTKMCINCLNNHLANIVEYQKELDQLLAGIDCECCRSYPTFLKKITQGLNVVCLTKIKINKQVCPRKIRALIHMETTTVQNIKTELASVMEKLTEATTHIIDPLCEGKYLNKVDQIKGLYDMLESMDKADHR